MKTFLIALSLAIVAIISIPLYLVAFILKCTNPMMSHRFAQRIVIIVFRLWIFISGADYKIIGRDRVPTDEPVLFIANHRSFFDVFFGYAFIPTPTAFVSKASIKKIPCIAQWMYFLSCSFLDREDLKSGMEMIKHNISVISDKKLSVFICPEGGRNNTDELLEFKEGSFRIATRTNCKIVPICYTNTENIFEAHLPWVKKASVTMEFGEPIDTSSLSRDEQKHLGVKVREIIQDMYDERRNNTND